MKKYILFFCLFIFLGLVKGQACTERVNGGSFSYWDGNVWGSGTVYWDTRNYPSADYGFVFDLTFLDNAFDLEINGVWIHPNKLEFHHGCVTQGCTTANVKFADGSYFGYGGIPNVWSFGTVPVSTPVVRVVISATGVVSLFGSKYVGGPLLPLVTTDGLLQNVTWNTTGNNTVRFWQPKLGPTGMAGVAYGLKNAVPVTINTQPISATYCQNAAASLLSVAATGGTGLSYQWYSNTVNNNTSGTLISGATSSTYTPPTTTAGTRYYYVRVSNANGCSAISSAVSIITDDNCQCYKPAVITGTSLETKHGISALGRAGVDNGNWPMVRKGAWTALESKTKGFVINRIPTTAQVNTLPNPVEGMMVYDEQADCLKIYTTTNGTTSWQCFNTQACPDN